MTGSTLLFWKKCCINIINHSEDVVAYFSLPVTLDSLQPTDASACYCLLSTLSFLLFLSSHSVSLFHSSAPDSQSLICITPFHKHTQLHHPTRPDSWTLSLSSPLPYKAMLVRPALALRPDTLIKAGFPGPP